jgi:excisionase family DNA binding protein
MADAVAPEPLAITYPEAARLTGLSVRSIKRAVADGRLPVSRTGRSARIVMSDLRAFIAAGRTVGRTTGAK